MKQGETNHKNDRIELVLQDMECKRPSCQFSVMTVMQSILCTWGYVHAIEVDGEPCNPPSKITKQHGGFMTTQEFSAGNQRSKGCV